MNKVVLIGRITKDLDIRKTADNRSFARFTLAVNRNFKSKDGNTEADFISCVVWEKRAETMYQYLGKGSLVAIEGRIQTGSYDDKDGKRVYTTDVVVESFDFLESKGQREGRGQATSYYEPAPAYQPNSSYVDSFDEPILDIASDDLPF